MKKVNWKQSLMILFFGLMLCGLQAQGSQYYHLIAASFDKFDQASASVQKMKQEGYQAVILFPHDDVKVYRVSIYQSTNKTEISRYQSQLKAQGKKAGWILALKAPESAPANLTSRSSNSSRRVSSGAATTAESNTETGTYHLIVGSFVDYPSAERLIEALQSQGFDPYPLFPDEKNSSYKVSVYTTNNRKEMEAYADMMKKRGKEKGWIYEEAATGFNPNRRVVQPALNNAGFYLIGGSFNSFEQASRFSEEQREKGHNSSVLYPQFTNSTHYRVALFQSANKSAVEAYKKKFDQKGKQIGWIYEKK